MNRTDLTNLLALGEGFTTEFKRSNTSNLGREICAFANATGGVILLGVTDLGETVGVNDHNRLKSEVQVIARSAEPPIAVEVESVGEVLCVTVPAQQSKPYSFGGKFFLREGASSQQMSRDEIREFFFKEGLIHFDETPCPNYDLDNDLTSEIWARFASRAGIPPSMERETALRSLHLVKDGRMTHAGAWLLCDDITRFTLRAGVTCALFRGTTNVHILDRKDFSGDLHSIYEDGMAYVQSRLNTALIPHARGRDERLELPQEALREALVNAIVHRDYRSTANVQVHIYHDRLEIITPGGLPAGMKEEELGHRSVPRNPLLFGLFYRMNLVEQIGSGIQRIRDLCHEYRMVEPRFDVSENWVTVVFPRVVEGRVPEVAEQVGAKLGLSRDQVSGEVAGQAWLQPESQPESRPESRPESLEMRVLALLRNGPMAKSALSIGLGQKRVSGHLNKIIRLLLDDEIIEYTIPDKPNTRLQRYLLTAKGKESLEKRGGRQSASPLEVP